MFNILSFIFYVLCFMYWFFKYPKIFLFCSRFMFTLCVSCLMFYISCSLLRRDSYFIFLIAYFKWSVSRWLCNVSCKNFLNTSKFFFFAPVSCLRFVFHICCSIFYVHYYGGTHILCLLLHILSDMFHVGCAMFHVLIF